MNHFSVQAGQIIPRPLEEFPKDPSEYILVPEHLRDIHVDVNYPYVDKSLKGRLLNWLIYIGLHIAAFIANPVRYGLKIEGRSKFKKFKKEFKDGAMTVANHVYRWDFPAIVQAVKFRRLWFPARKENLEGSDANLIRGAGGIPVPSSPSALRKFNDAFDELHSKKSWFHYFPEASRWDFYTPIRPFHKGAFTIAYKYRIPIIPMAFSFREPTGIYKLLKVKHPLITLRVGEPIFVDETLSRSENIEMMIQKAHEQVVELAGIKNNPWPSKLV